MKTIVVGVGNEILGDDGVGLCVADELKKLVKDKNVTIEKAATGGINLLDLIIGYEKVIIVDAIRSKKGKHGDVKLFSLENFNDVHSFNPHDFSLVEAIEMAKRLGEKNIPKEIVIVGIVLKNTNYEFSENLSYEISKAIPKAVDMVIDQLKDRCR